MTITFIGHGYVGLVTAAVFADLGNKVWVIGHTPEKVNNLKKGIIPIYEPGLEELVKRNVDAERLLFTMEYSPAIAESEVVFIAVGTPPLGSGEADLSVVFDVAKKVGENLDGYTVVITKSTVPVGTNRKVQEIVDKAKSADAKFDIASVPEFLREGQAISDTLRPDRIVIGSETKRAKDTLIELHKPISTPDVNLQGNYVLTNIETAEMIKYASNAFLATKISFANAIAQLSEKVGADGPRVLDAVGSDKRIGMAFLNAGAGYGGSCFPKDVKALIAISKENGYSFDLLDEVEAINDQAMAGIVKKAEELLGGDYTDKTIGILGLAFKPDTDDIRFAPALRVIDELIADGKEKNLTIKVYDPIAMDNVKRGYKDNLTYMSNAYEAAEGADVLIVMTEWNEFRQLDLEKVKKLMRTPKLIDGRNIYEPEEARELGFTYLGVGR